MKVDASGRWIYLARGNGVLASRDGGQSRRLTGGIRLAEVRGLCIDRRQPERVWVASAHGVFRSEDS